MNVQSGLRHLKVGELRQIQSMALKVKHLEGHMETLKQIHGQ